MSVPFKTRWTADPDEAVWRTTTGLAEASSFCGVTLADASGELPRVALGLDGLAGPRVPRVLVTGQNLLVCEKDGRACGVEVVARALDESPRVRAWVKNERLGLTIPYRHGQSLHQHTPDFLISLVDGTTLVVEVKGLEREQDRSKEAGARRWIMAALGKAR